nr:uncharacterized protein LOC105866567 [Microcebus murinus]
MGIHGKEKEKGRHQEVLVPLEGKSSPKIGYPLHLLFGGNHEKNLMGKRVPYKFQAQCRESGLCSLRPASFWPPRSRSHTSSFSGFAKSFPPRPRCAAPSACRACTSWLLAVLSVRRSCPLEASPQGLLLQRLFTVRKRLLGGFVPAFIFCLPDCSTDSLRASLRAVRWQAHRGDWPLQEPAPRNGSPSSPRGLAAAGACAAEQITKLTAGTGRCRACAAERITKLTAGRSVSKRCSPPRESRRMESPLRSQTRRKCK